MAGDSWGYHSRVSIEHRYVCMTVPKVACTTVKRTLRAFEGLPEIADHGVLHENDEQPRLSSLTEAEALDVLKSPQWLRFAIVRNPYDRMFSAWKSKVAVPWDAHYARLRDDLRASAGLAFADFVRYVIGSGIPEVTNDGHWAVQSDILLADVIPYDVIGRFETFVEDFTAILRSLDAPDHVLAMAAEVTNATAQVPLAAAYDRQLASEVYRYYEADFEAFGYARDSWMVA